MKFKPLIGAQMSGSIGGITASHNRGGPYFRQRATPTNPGSTEQSVVRNAFASLASLWSSTLTAAQRAAWRDYADATPITDAVGDSIVLPGLSWYQACNVPRLQVGLARVDDGPTTPGLAECSEIAVGQVAADTDGYTVTFDNSDVWAATDGGALAFYGSSLQSVGKNFFKGPYRLAGTVDGNTSTPPTSPQVLTSAFNIATGRKYFWQARALAPDGRISPVQRGGLIAIAT